jgi:hypothetical protein
VKWLPSLYDRGPARRWRIGYALAVCFAAAMAGLALLWWVALVLVLHPAQQGGQKVAVRDTVGVAQLVFASVAGAGALVALVVAYRRQRVAEDRTPVFNERFATIAAELGDDKPAVRLAGVHAMAGLADDWMENRQTCVDVLCTYLRLPYDKDPIEGITPGKRQTGNGTTGRTGRCATPSSASSACICARTPRCLGRASTSTLLA